MTKIVIVVIVCVVVAAFIGFGGKFLSNMTKYKKAIADIVIETPDISRIQNGTYNGVFDANMISADVDVIVKDHRITEIVLNEHNNGRGASAEAITEEVILKQSLEVDTISGATNSSKVILKAIEIALENGN